MKKKGVQQSAIYISSTDTQTSKQNSTVCCCFVFFGRESKWDAFVDFVSIFCFVSLPNFSRKVSPPSVIESVSKQPESWRGCRRKYRFSLAPHARRTTGRSGQEKRRAEPLIVFCKMFCFLFDFFQKEWERETDRENRRRLFLKRNRGIVLMEDTDGW